MKIQQFEYFIAVVEQNSFTKAAQILHISQPSLTTAIKKLEDSLGYELLTRTTKEIKITDRGIQFYQYARHLIHEYQLTVEKMYDLNLSDVPKLKLSILESTNQWVSAVISQHAGQHPGQRYQLLEIHDYDKVIQDVINFDIHIALTNEQVKHSDIESIPLYEEEYVVLAPQQAFTDQQSTALDTLPLIVPNAKYQVRKHLDDYLLHLNIRPHIVMEVDRFETAANFVHEGLGYAVIPRVYYQSRNTSSLKTLTITPPLKRTIYINYHKKRKHSPGVLSLIDSYIRYWSFE